MTDPSAPLLEVRDLQTTFRLGGKLSGLSRWMA
jgi:hypothetical protein